MVSVRGRTKRRKTDECLPCVDEDEEGDRGERAEQVCGEVDARDGGVPVRLRSVREVHGNDEAAHQAWYTSPGSSWTSTIWRP